MLDHIDIPNNLLINSPRVKQIGYEETAELIFDLVKQRLNIDSFANLDILDIGCGTRFTRAIINRKIPIKSYTGIELNKGIVDFFQQEVSPKDDRFHYAHWDVYNIMYNQQGTKMQDCDALPVPGDYDLIWLFSVFTHLNPEDASTLLGLMRKKIRPEGKLFFTAHTSDETDRFEDRIKHDPLLRAFYNTDFLKSLIVENGWHIDGFYPKDNTHFVKNHFVCSPA